MRGFQPRLSLPNSPTAYQSPRSKERKHFEGDACFAFSKNLVKEIFLIDCFYGCFRNMPTGNLDQLFGLLSR